MGEWSEGQFGGKRQEGQPHLRNLRTVGPDSSRLSNTRRCFDCECRALSVRLLRTSTEAPFKSDCYDDAEPVVTAHLTGTFGQVTGTGDRGGPDLNFRGHLRSVAVLMIIVVGIYGLPRHPTAEATTVPPGPSGYWLVASDGGVFSFGQATWRGSAGTLRLNSPIVGMAATRSANGYWLVAADGGIFAYGDAVFYGSTGDKRLNSPIVGMATSPSGQGYWLVAADGGIFAYGDAGFFGSTGDKRLNSPIVGLATTPSSKGYWLVGADGGVFAFGDVGFHGSAGGATLRSPIVGMTAILKGYWLVAADGGVFAYGEAAFLGSGADATQDPVVGMALGLPPYSQWGYRLVTNAGSIRTFGGSQNLGDLSKIKLNHPIVGIVALTVPLFIDVVLFTPPIFSFLRQAEEDPRTGYDRDLFGHWIDLDEDGCDTRREVLIEESTAPATTDSDCSVTGQWLSQYDGVTTSDPSTLDVDHMVPLAEAWDSGASHWDARRREAFANDLDYEYSLIAVSASSNRSKGDQDPAEWQPPNPQIACQYAQQWSAVKVRWDLSADAAEVAAVWNMARYCDPRSFIDPPPLVPVVPPVADTGLTFADMQCDAPGSPDDATNINDEWVEIANGGVVGYDLTGWTVVDEAGNSYTFPTGRVLDPDTKVRVHSGQGTNTGTDLFWGRSQHVWNNGGDVASLRDSADTLLATKAC
jgi:lamin tail-like protein/uncharacterized protein DUF1524